jgi:type I site-specific restriction endonuclease
MTDTILLNEKKLRKGEKFKKEETKGDIFRKKLKKILPGDRKENKTIPVSHSYKNKDVKEVAKNIKEKNAMMTKSESLDKAKKFMDTLQTMKSKDMTEKEGSFAKGGRAGFKSGMRVCKLAKKGKGRAYGKNS